MRQAYIIKELGWLKQEDPNWRSCLKIKIYKHTKIKYKSCASEYLKNALTLEILNLLLWIDP